MKKDFYTSAAKKSGLRARSAFKLLQINKAFKIVKKGYKVLDLGCWPGGWLLVAKKLGAYVVGIDEKEIEKIEGVKFIKGSVFNDELLKGLGKFDTILSDLSPKISGIPEIDIERSIELCKKALSIADEKLKMGGNFVCKIFQGKGVEEFLEKIRKKFRFVRCYKPSASKKRSKEIYVIAKYYKG